VDALYNEGANIKQHRQEAIYFRFWFNANGHPQSAVVQVWILLIQHSAEHTVAAGKRIEKFQIGRISSTQQSCDD
jgi:hypothetical protein